MLLLILRQVVYTQEPGVAPPAKAEQVQRLWIKYLAACGAISTGKRIARFQTIVASDKSGLDTSTRILRWVIDYCTLRVMVLAPRLLAVADDRWYSLCP